MNREDIHSAISVGAGRSVCVHLERPSMIPGYVRSISIHAENRVQVAFEVEGLEEGGAYFWGTYPTLDLAIDALERFLKKPLAEWNAPHLAPQERPRVSPDHDALASAIRSNAIALPPGAQYRLQDSYWSGFLKSAPKRARKERR